jgi:hypothetical protein
MPDLKGERGGRAGILCTMYDIKRLGMINIIIFFDCVNYLDLFKRRHDNFSIWADVTKFVTLFVAQHVILVLCSM